MVVKTLQEMKGKDRGHKMSHQELISQRRKTNSPTIEDDFTIDLDVEEEEPFDEPKSTPRAETKIIIGTRPKNSSSRSDRVNAEIDMLSWTGSELDDGDGKKCHRGAKDKSKSIHSLVWSESELDDTRDNNVNERDDFNETRGKAESRDGKTESDANMRTVSAQNRSALEEHKQKTIYKKQQSKSTVQFCMENDNKNSNKEKVLKSKKSSAQPENNKVREATKKKEYDNMAIRTERSTDSGIAEDESNVYDGISAFSITPSVAPSVTASVTRRTRNTRNPKSPRTPRTARRTSFGDTETTTGEASVLTAEVVEKMNDRCSMMPGKKKQNRSATKKGQSKSVGEEDLLDRFFDNIESRVCKTPRRRENEKDGLKRLINPFLVRLEQFDCIFEHLEEIACPEEDEADDDSRKTRPSTPAAFAAATFSQLLDQIEKFDPVFAKVKATSCQTNCDIYGGNDMEEGCCDSVDEDMSKVSVQENEEPNNNSPYEVLEKAYERAEQMVKDQKQTSCDEKDQLQKMKEQWYEAKSNWKLRQSILLEAVRLNTAKAAETTTKYMETIVSSCHPSMSSEMMGDENHKKNEDGKVPRHFSIKESSKDLDSVSDASEVYRDASEVYHDAASIDNSDFSSMMSPSEHSNINSKHVAFRSNLLSPSEHSNIHSSRRTSRSVAFDDLNEEASYTEDNPEASVGISNSPLAVIKEEVAGAESTTSESSSNRKSKGAKASVSPKTIRRWAYPAPAYYNEKSNNGRESEMPPTNPKEWINMWKDTVDSVSGKILDRAQCASASINLADSNSFEDDTEKNRTGMKQQNSIIEYEENSVSIIAGGESVDNDDLSGFESAVNTMDFEQDERPPMLRLMKSRTDSRSCGSRGGSHDEVECTKSNSKSGSVRSRLSTDTPESYTLAESIRNSSLSDQNNEANATRVMKEPRGNKVKTDPSSHIRGGSVPTPAPQKPDPESKQKDRERIRSPKSSETNETSDMTAVSASSSDVVVTQMADSTHLIIPMVVGEEKSEGKESTDDLESTENSPVNTPTAVADDDADKATVFSYNTTSTGSTEFKDCYQDAIPSMSTMGTVLEDEMPTVSAQKKNQRGESLKNIRGTSFLASDANIVKSVALLSVSATVLKSAQNTTSAFNDSELFEMESVPSTSSYTQEEAVLASISEETDISDEESLINQETDQSPCTLLVDNSIVKASVTEESIKNSSKEGGPNRILGTLHEAIDLEETAMEDTDGNPNKLHHEDNRVEEELKDRKLRREECFPKHQMSKMDISEPMRKYDSNDQSTPFKGIPSIEKMNINKHLRTAFEQATVDSKINPDDLILESLQQQESVQKQERIRLNSHQFQETMQPENMLVEQSSIDEPMTDLKPKHQYEELTMSDSSKPLYGLVGNEDEVKSNSASTSRTKKISSKLREPRSVEDRRRRRLRQRRKFEKILRGEDDSSTMSSSTMSGGGSHHDSKLQNEEQGDKKSNNGQAGAPLISASFDTGFGSAPVIEESQQYY